MDPDPASGAQPRTTYTLSLTARACLQAVQLAAWLEAMVIAYRAVSPDSAGAWLWFVVRCLLFTLGAHAVVGIAAEFAKRRSARGRLRFSDGALRKRDGDDSDGDAGKREAPGAIEQIAFDRVAFDAAGCALLFHFGASLWMWIFV